MPDERDALPTVPPHPAWTDERWRVFCDEDRRTGGATYRELLRLIDDRLYLLLTDWRNTWPRTAPGYDHFATVEALNQNNAAIRRAIAAVAGHGPVEMLPMDRSIEPY